jgi:pyruvate kinase
MTEPDIRQARLTRGLPSTKIVCTLGPATQSEEQIRDLVWSGMSIARLNLSHGTLDEHRAIAARVRRIADDFGVAVGVMVDVPGRKYRTGPTVPGGVSLKRGDRVVLTSEASDSADDRVTVSPPGFHRDAIPAYYVLIDDGRIRLRVRSVEGLDVYCEAMTAGTITAGRGVTSPGQTSSLPFPSKEDLEALNFAAECRADFVALSTVVARSDVDTAREVLSTQRASPHLISKIEQVEALERFDEILDASDAVMVARGDLGTEDRLSRIPLIQKDLISRCNAAGKPVITATQMLESMINSPTPTRAEATDVATAVFDGTDAVMLSGETSIGDYPVEAVLFMAEVAREAEAALPYADILEERGAYREQKTDDAMGYNAVQTASQLDASVIVAFTESGGTAGRVSRYRPGAPVLALTPHEKITRLLTLRWGVTPLTIKQPETVDDMFNMALESVRSTREVSIGSKIVLVAGLPIGVPGGTNLLRVLEVGV